MEGKSLKRNEAIKLLNKYGFELVRESKHYIFKNDEGEVIALPRHGRVSQKTWKRELKKHGIEE